MSLHWIKITERAREGIKIVNNLKYEVFCTVLDYVDRNMNHEDHDEPENALEDLEKLVGVPRTDFLLLIKTLSYILKRTSTFIIKPTKLQSELREKLRIGDDKVDAIIKLWIKNTKPILDNLESKNISENELNDVTWKLKVQMASHCQQKEKTPIACLQLRTVEGPNIDLEMSHEELSHLYNQLELIQNELDSLRSSR
ncbi:uncharacterized protein LOC129614793 [Condylostylus longicornis]|uniref:uncharacterized protein LOC129614793 n=1 Tax=Condylostylus longicornis TaxID=2530218 RepID=UPI00244D9A1C|nr:uncharacterized protein LOC129614793 [Condylostylus longicornis]